MFLSSVARGRGLKFSPKFGVVDPAQGDKVVADNWNDIATILLGKGATEKDTHTVERMIELIKKDPNYDTLVGPFRDEMVKSGRTLPESDLSRMKQLSGL